MAKSTGNVVLLRDLTARGLDPLAVRLAFLEHRYRQQLNLTWETLDAADGTVRRWRDQVAELGQRAEQADVRGVLRPDLRRARRRPGHPGRAAGAAGAGSGPGDPGRLEVRDVRRRRPGARPGPGPPGRAAADGRAALPGRSGRRCWPSGPPRASAKDFAASDRLRAELADLGVAVADTPEGQTWSLSEAAAEGRLDGRLRPGAVWPRCRHAESLA